MKAKLYMETTIPSYLTARPNRDLIVAGNQQLTWEWWETQRERFAICISQFVLDEAGAGDPEVAQKRLDFLQPFPLLDINTDVTTLASGILQSGLIPIRAATDAAHIAVAAVHQVQFLMTWNCKHLANAELSESLRSLCSDFGYTCPVICTPAELMGG